jgi:mannitol-1-/sugar-/sorbitol-6-phosphatase
MTAPSSLSCDAVIFDLDGVLIDSNPISERHWRAWAARHGIGYDLIEPVHHGRPTVETMRLVAPHLDAVFEADEKETAEVGDTEGLIVFEGAIRLLRSLPAQRWGIATSGRRRTATLRFAQTGLPTPLVLVTADEVVRGKPGPEPYLLAAERLGVPPARCVVIEDAPAGVASARAAGAQVIAVASTTDPAALVDADVVVASLDDLEIAQEGEALRVRWRSDLHPTRIP